MAIGFAQQDHPHTIKRRRNAACGIGAMYACSFGGAPVGGVQVLDALLEAVVQAVDVGDAVVCKAAQCAHRRQVLLHVPPQPLSTTSGFQVNVAIPEVMLHLSIHH